MNDKFAKLSNATKKIDVHEKYHAIPSRKNDFHSLTELKNLRHDSLEAWILSGRLIDASKRIAELGHLNRKGQPYSDMSVRKYALEYIVFYPEDARKIYQKLQEFPNTTQGDLEWTWHVINIAVRIITSKHRFIRWAVQKNLYKTAFNIFKDLYNLTDEDYHAFDDILGSDDKQE